MRIRRIDPKTIEISGLDSVCCELLHHIVPAAQIEDCPAARERLFSSPTRGADPELERDWKNYVQPDLQAQFRSAQDVVSNDLEPLSQNAEGSSTLHLPVRHLDDWIHCLNQARLALSARYDFTESEMESPLPFDGDQRALALFQVHFYGFLQECFLRQLE